MSLEEWTKLFFHEEPQSASYVDGAPPDTVDEDPAAPLQEPADLPPPEVPDVEPIAAESPQPAAGFAGVAVKSEVEKFPPRSQCRFDVVLIFFLINLHVCERFLDYS